MSASSPHEIARAAELAVRSVPGVAALYRTGTPVGNAIAAAVSLLAGTEGQDLVEVSERNGALHVTVSIGVVTSAAETCRAVHDRLDATLRALGRPDSTIHVTVAHVPA